VARRATVQHPGSRKERLGLLADGTPRSRPAIVEALVGRHGKREVVHTLICLSVTGQVEETGGKYVLGTASPG
jgi:hypothetical protein